MLQRVHVMSRGNEAELIHVFASVVAPLRVLVVGVVNLEEVLVGLSLRADLCRVEVGVALEGVGGLPLIGGYPASERARECEASARVSRARAGVVV